MKPVRIARAALLLFVLIGLVPRPAQTDTLTGEIRGKILDVQGQVPLAGAIVVLTNTDRGWKKTLTTNTGGDYLFLQLEPGNYSLTIEKEGYYKTEKTDVLVPLNQPKVIIPPISLRKLVSTPTREVTLRGEQSKTAIIDLTAPGPTPSVLAFIREPGSVALASLLHWTMQSNYPAVLLQSLPLRGLRSFDQVALLSPGVFRVPFTSGEGPATGIGVGGAGQFSVNGSRGRGNNFTVDGSDNNDEDIGVRRQGFVSLIPQSIDSVQELQIVTAGFSADSGRNHGSMVNAVSRPGEKNHHGSLYGFFNTSALNAEGRFDTPFRDVLNTAANSGGGFSGSDSSWQQYGGTAGGPIVAGKLFYYVSAEQQRLHGTKIRQFVVPSTQERGLRTKDGFVPIEDLKSFLGPDINYYDNAGKGVFSLYPLPNNTAGPFGANNYSEAREADGTGTIASSRLDWYLSSTQSVFGRYNLTDDNATLPFTSEAIHSTLATSTRTQNLSLFWNGTFARYTSALRFSYGRTRLAFPTDKGSPLIFGSDPGGSSIQSQPITTPYGRFGPFGATGPIGQLRIDPYSTIGVDVFNFPQGRVDNTFQASEFLTRAWARHTLKFGFDIRRSQLNSYSDRNSRPLVQFGYGRVSSTCMANPTCPFATSDGLLRGTDLAALGAPAGFLQTISTPDYPDTTIGLRITQYDIFAQDDWKVRPNLSINLGLRYELQTVPVEVNSRIEKYLHLKPEDFGHMEPTGTLQNRNIINAGNYAFDASIAALNDFLEGRDKISDQDYKRFSPRVGFAWDPLGSGKLSIRGGYSLVYDANIGAVTSQSRNVFPTLAPVNLDPSFQPPTGVVINSPAFFVFTPKQTALIRPGTLNTFNISKDAFATAMGTLFAQTPPSPGAGYSSNGLAFTLPERILKPAYAQQMAFSIERQFGANYLASLAFVRTAGSHLLRFATPNAGLLSTPILLSDFSHPLRVYSIPPVLVAGNPTRPDPGLGAVTVFANSASSAYNSMQASIEKRLSRGLQGRFHWTWSHAIDEVSDPFDGRGFFSLPQNSLNFAGERASANFDSRHRVALFVVWDMPVFADSILLKNWKWAAVGEFQTGQPYTVNSAVDRNVDGNLTDRLDSLSGISLYPGDAIPVRLDTGANPLSLIAAKPGLDGRIARNSFTADGIAAIDLAISRLILLPGESHSLSLRVEFLNLFNGTSFGIPIRILESPGFGRTFDTQVEPRAVRFSVRLQF